MSEFHFLRPLWFLALLPAFALLILLWLRRGQAGNWQAIVAPALLSHLLLERGQGKRRLPLALLGLGWLLAVTALAGPAWERQPQPVYRVPVDRVIVLDMSPSMAVRDLQPDRLSRARLGIRELLEQMQEGRVALVVFGAEAHVVTPLTDDVATIRALLPALTTDILPAPGDRAAPALRIAGELLRRAGSAQGQIVLLSDGVGDPAAALEAVHALQRRDVRTHVLGLGTLGGAPLPAAQGSFETDENGGIRLARLDETGLVELARSGGGHYRRLDEAELSTFLPGMPGRDPARASIERAGLERWVEQGPWLLLPLLLLAASAFRRGWLAMLVVLVLPPPPVHAFSWQDLWLRPDQQAARLLEQGDAAAAAERFEHPGWRATASYRAGDYTAAVQGFDGEDPDSRYNRGNALARAGRLEEALEAYEQALEKQPGHADARFNRALVEQLLQAQLAQDGHAAAAPAEQREAQAATDRQAGTGSGSVQQSVAAQGQRSSGQDAAADTLREGAADGDVRQGEAGTGSPSQDAGRPGQPPHGEHGMSPAQQRSDHASAAVERQPAAGDAAGQPASTAPPGAPDRNPDRAAGRSDSAAQARADVAPAVDSAAPGQPAMQAEAQAPASEARGAVPNDGAPQPMSEQQLALEQWLRQVPDDPAGLLRRKFMLEHLLRQQRQPSP